MTKQDLKTLNFNGVLTATSNKKGKFKNSDPRKTAYFEVVSKEKEKLEKFGLTEYTPENGNPFFVIKMGESIDIFNEKGECKTIQTTVEDPNLESVGEIKVAILKGCSDAGNDYVRVYALGVTEFDEIIEKEKTNPFANL